MKQNNNYIETRVALLEQSIGHINQNLIRLDGRFDEVDKKFVEINNTLDRKLSDINTTIQRIDSRMWTNFYWLLSTMFTLAGVCAGILAQGFGWFK